MSYFNTAIRCVNETKDIFLNGFSNKKNIIFKGDIDLVTSVDKEIEEKVINIILSDHPNHDILAEESVQKEKKSSYRWIIDPLDGTTNFAHNVPHVALSIALERDDKLILGVVYNPMSGELFTAEKGKGAFLNEIRISVSNTPNLLNSLLATGFPYDCHQYAKLYTDELKKIMEKSQGIRRFGVASLDLCFVACGRFDGFWERKLSPWDVAASLLIIDEAGGLTTTFGGKNYALYDDTIIASNKLIHNEIISTLTS
ncbi:MAG: inositol monophosphatase [Spirochaetota bacterium]|nr:inositol monophosphatase [Spirochaetota bacterium]